MACLSEIFSVHQNLLVDVLRFYNFTYIFHYWPRKKVKLPVKINGRNSTCGLNVKSEDAVPMGIRQTLKVLSIGFNVGLIGTNTDPAKFNRCFTHFREWIIYLMAKTAHYGLFAKFFEESERKTAKDFIHQNQKRPI